MSLQNIELENLKKSFLTLSPELQEQFVEFALEKTDDFNLTLEQKKELDKRLEEIENGTAKLIPYNTVKKEIKNMLCDIRSPSYIKPEKA